MPGVAVSIPRLVIAAPQGRSGKTTVSLGLCAAFASRGFAVQPFKKGPDYIDPSWLSEAAGRPCRNLDPFFMPSSDTLVAAFARPFLGATEGRLAIVEGNHGLYDSLDEDGSGSTAAVARTLQAPVLLVVNTARMGRSVAAMVHGYLTFEPDTPIRGVILNNVARGRHEDKLREAIETNCGVPVLGALPRSDALTIPERHLGLVPRAEDSGLIPALEACRVSVQRYCDLDAILGLAHAALPLDVAPTSYSVGAAGVADDRRPVIAVFRDRAFSFYYHENLEVLADAGARLVFVDAFTAGELPACDLLYIGGGFPEVFMEELSANQGLIQAVRHAAERGLPIYAECGGMMYLARRLSWGDRTARMCGVMPVEVEMTGRPQGHGYVEASVDAPNPYFKPGASLRGHEFHNSRVTSETGLPTAYRLTRGAGVGGSRDAFIYRNILASYTHLHAAGAPDWALSLVRRALHSSSD